MFKKNVKLGFDINWDKIPDESQFKKSMQFVSPYVIANWHQFYIVNGLPIYLEKKHKSIAITLSGGADSTMLAFLICSILDELKWQTEIHFITLVRFWKERSGTEDASTNVVSMIKEMFPNRKMTHHIGFVPTALETTKLGNLTLENGNPLDFFTDNVLQNATADVYAVKDYTDYVACRNGVTMTYSGLTMNPPASANLPSIGPKFREATQLTKENLSQYKITRAPYFDPFELINKDWVMAQYENFGLEKLRDATRSCESTDIKLNALYGEGNWKTTNSKYSCGTCFFCYERQWAIENAEIFLERNHK